MTKIDLSEIAAFKRGIPDRCRTCKLISGDEPGLDDHGRAMLAEAVKSGSGFDNETLATWLREKYEIRISGQTIGNHRGKKCRGSRAQD